MDAPWALGILEELEKSYRHKEPVDLKAPRIEIEHVMPQTLSEEWKITLGGEWQRVYGTYLHTLGNLTLSGYNQELYDDPFLKKRDRLAKSNLQLKSYFASVTVWDEAAIVARALFPDMSTRTHWSQMYSLKSIKT